MNDLRRVTLGWYRTVFCNNLLTTAMSAVLAGGALLALFLHYIYFGPTARSIANYSDGLMLAMVLLGAFVGFYALTRGMAFHPALDFRYHEWLKSSPWAPGAALPKGPITPVWQDCVLLIAATTIALNYCGETAKPEFIALFPTTMMALGFALSWSAANVVTRNLFAVYLTLLAAAAAMHLTYQTPESMFAVGAVTAAAVAYWGVRRGLRAYPWPIVPFNKEYWQRLLNPYEERTASWQTVCDVGWPYAQLLMTPQEIRVPWQRAALEAAIVAAWTALLGRSLGEDIWGWIFVLGIALVGFKFFYNSLLICSRLCVGERQALGRPLIWNHDRWLIQPLVLGAVLLGLGYLWVEQNLGPHWLGAAISAFLGVWLCRRLGRPIAEGFYTGHQSLRGVSRQPQYFEKLASPGE